MRLDPIGTAQLFLQFPRLLYILSMEGSIAAIPDFFFQISCPDFGMFYGEKSCGHCMKGKIGEADGG